MQSFSIINGKELSWTVANKTKPEAAEVWKYLFITSNPFKIGTTSLCRFSIMLNYLNSFIYAIVPDNDTIIICNTINYTIFIFAIVVLYDFTFFYISKGSKLLYGLNLVL